MKWSEVKFYIVHTDVILIIRIILINSWDGREREIYKWNRRIIRISIRRRELGKKSVCNNKIRIVIIYDD